MATSGLERRASTLERGGQYSGYLDNLKPLALLVAVLVFVLTILFIILDIKAAVDPPYLAFILNILFIFAPSLLIAFMTVRGFRQTGAWSVLWLGIGTLTFGLGAFLGGLFVTTANADIAITVTDLVFCLGAALHLHGAIFILYGVPDQSDDSRRPLVIRQVYLAVMTIIFSILMLSIYGILPSFFITGAGVTPLRQMVIGATVIMLLVTSLVLFRQYFRTKSPLIYWYAFGLLLLSLGVVGFLMMTSLGTPLNWIGRLSQLLGGLYLLAAAMVAMQEARLKHLSTGESLSGLLSATQARLRGAERRFRLVFERAGIGITLSDADGRIVESNLAFERMLGYTKEELRNKSFTEFTHPEDALLELSYIQEMRAGKRENYEIEKRYIRKDKNAIWVRLFRSMIPGDRGELEYGIALAENITERRKAEEALRESEERYRSLFESIDEGFCIVEMIFNHDGKPVDARLLETNPAFERQSGLHGAKGQLVSHVIPTIEQFWLETFGRIALTGRPERFTNEAGALRRWYDVYAFRLEKLGSDKVAALFTDITERKKAERMKDEFIGMVSHEIKTPLTVTMGALHTIRREGLSEAEVDGLLSDAVNSAETLASIVENLLELSRSQANRLQLHMQYTNIGQVARGVVQKLQSTSELHRLKLDMQEGLGGIKVDPVRVERILYNLVENAIKYSPKGGDVTVSARREGNELVVCVRDQGPGISPDNQKKLFQSFEQLDISNRRSIQGVGLGLKVCRTLVEAHGGRIWVESEPGKGANFCFTLRAEGNQTSK